MLAGVVLPAVAVGVEVTTRMCAETFFDPIPTLWHVLLAAFVPLVNLQVWREVRRGATERGALLAMANAVAVGVSIFYTVVYLPLLPLAVVALVFFGIGILPMAPLFALISAVVLRRQLLRIAPFGLPAKMTGLGLGLAVAFAAVALLELPSSLTRVGMRMAASDSAGQRERGLRWLRAVGSNDYILRACYERSGRATDLIGFLLSLDDPVTPDEAREIYYRLNGETFDSVPPPERLSGRWAADDRFDFDTGQGGTAVAGRLKNLSLASSRLDGSVDGEAALGYVEWTLVFKNDAAWQQEARAQVQLPPGGVVTRLTLWVNGEEREAAFAGRSQVREAYQQVVRQ
ncbi:MAG: VIT domain-containing protein, partial [Pyrinomonadaceae bacterium]